jgi:hypothetical protein
VKHKLLAILAAGLLAGPMAADAVTLTYTGNNFANLQSSGPTTPSDPYTTADKITGSLQIAAPLPANLLNASITPTSFTFTDGIFTFTDGNATNTTFIFSTNGSGEIVNWIVIIESNTPTAGGGTNNFLRTLKESFSLDLAQDILCGPDSTNLVCAFAGDPFYQQQGYVSDVPGAWIIVDADSDGVPDAADQCPATVIPESAPTLGTLKKNHYALRSAVPNGAGLVFFTTTNKNKNKTNFTTADTAGCSCEQIVAALGLGVGQLKYGCSKSAMEAWIIGLP